MTTESTKEDILHRHISPRVIDDPEVDEATVVVYDALKKDPGTMAG